MLARRSHPLATYALVALYTLGQVLFSSFGVICRDASGTSRFEFACERTCESRCDAAGPAAHAPSAGGSDTDHSGCQDEFVGRTLQIGSRVSSEIRLDLQPAAAEVAWLPEHWLATPDVATPPSIRCVASEPERPPGVIAQLRTIVILV